MKPKQGSVRRHIVNRPHALVLFAALTLAPTGLDRPMAVRMESVHARCGTWAVTPTPVPATPSGVLNAVAAVSTDNVWAVGSNGLGSALVEHWNGSRWRIIRAPSPRGSALLAVTALSARDIWAVGRSHFTNGYAASSYEPLIERWNGSSWKTIPSPRVPLGAQLEAISGLSFRDIWAVGDEAANENGSSGLTEHWNGFHWSVVSSPQPGTPNPSNELKAVVELAPRDVWTVGSGSTTELIEHWNGRSWAMLPGHTVNGELDALAAISSSNVWAGGFDLGEGRLLVEHWSGMRWRSVAIPALPGRRNYPLSSINALAATSRTDVWAVGDQPDRHSRDRMLVDHWNGRSWRAFYAMLPARARFNNLFGVAALPSGEVWAVGTGGINVSSLDSSGSYAGAHTQPNVGDVLTGMWNGHAWKTVPSPNPAGASGELNDVDATKASRVWAIGDRLGGGYDQPLAERWNGRRWLVTTTPRIAGRNAYLQSVEAFGSGLAWAAGWTTNADGSGDHRLLELWNGRRWSVIRDAKGAPAGQLFDVSAPSPTNVWAAGYIWRRHVGSTPLVEKWNGAAWQRMPTPPRMHQAASIVVVSARDVWVTSGGKSDRWNGNRWAAFSGSGASSLAASSSHDIWSAGSSSSTLGDDPTYYTPLAARWNGRTWQSEPAVDQRPSDQSDMFYDIADVTPSNVWAVGQSDEGPLAEHWNGQSFQVVDKVTSNLATGWLNGVDGAPADVWAVGSYDGDGGLNPLAERYTSCRG